MNPKQLAQDLAVVSLVADIAKEHRDRLRADMHDLMLEVGADATSFDIDGERIAKVSLIAPKAAAHVADEAALIRWVAERRPDEIVQSVRESYRKFLLDSLVAGPDGMAVDPATGEVVDGVHFTERAAYVSTRFDKDGRAHLAAAIKNGRVAVNLPGTLDVPALPGGEA